MIKINNLSKSFDNTIVFENVNLHVNEGDSIVIIGGSGCGKSTLLRCINTFETPDSGEIFIDGENIIAKKANIDKIRMKLGMIYKNFNLFTHLNVIENMILAPTKVLKINQEDAIKEAKQLLDMVGMRSRMYHFPSQLSGGQKQRVAIARSLMMHPKIMLFDEPTSALDPTMGDEVENVILKLKNNGMTCIIVTHEMHFAKEIATQVVFMAEKGIYEQNTPKNFFENPVKPLTRQFIYRSRIIEKNIYSNCYDIYTFHSEIVAFATPYGFSYEQQQSLSHIIDELIVPSLESISDNTIIVRFIAGENGSEHTLLIEFPSLDCSPIDNLDDLNKIILDNSTKEMKTCRNSNGKWEVNIKF